MRIRKMFMFTGLVIFTVLVLGVVWLLTTPKSVIWSYSENGEISSTPTFSIFNPFREKESEAEAERFLNILKNGDCKRAISSLHDQRNHEDLCERESRNKLESWKLTHREDSPKTVVLFYRAKRGSSSIYSGEMQFELTEDTDEWKITDIGFIY